MPNAKTSKVHGLMWLEHSDGNLACNHRSDMLGQYHRENNPQSNIGDLIHSKYNSYNIQKTANTHNSNPKLGAYQI